MEKAKATGNGQRATGREEIANGRGAYVSTQAEGTRGHAGKSQSCRAHSFVDVDNR